MRTLLLPLLLLLLLVFIEDQKVIQFFMRISLLWMRRDSEMTSQCFTHVKGSQQQGEGVGTGARSYVMNVPVHGLLVTLLVLCCDALLVKITSAQGIRFSGPSLSWPQGQQERRMCKGNKRNETKRNKTKRNEMQSVFIFLS